MSVLTEHLQTLQLGDEIDLYIIDLTAYGLDTIYWVGADQNSGTVARDGQVYTAWPIEVSGFEVSAGGPLARPTMAVGDVGGLLTPIVMANRNLRGAVVQRITTFARFLDGGDDENPDAHLAIEEYLIGRKTRHVPGQSIQWELQSSIDVAGTEIPARQIIRDYCDHSYRTYDGADFVYTDATCPYAGTDYFNAQGGTEADPADDVCGKRLGSCRARFGLNGELPFGGFPGASKIRVRR